MAAGRKEFFRLLEGAALDEFVAEGIRALEESLRRHAAFDVYYRARPKPPG